MLDPANEDTKERIEFLESKMRKLKKEKEGNTIAVSYGISCTLGGAVLMGGDFVLGWLIAIFGGMLLHKLLSKNED